MAARHCYLNGKIVPVEQATIRIDDSGFLHGASAFTTMLARNGVVFRLDRHLARLFQTVRFLELRTNATAGSLSAGVAELLDVNELADARLRITLTPGPVGADEPTTLITADALPDYPRQWYDKGITVIVTSYRQVPGDPTFGHKTGCYFPRLLARAEAASKGAAEALWFTSDNYLAEACFCNVFLVLDGRVHTPPLDTPVLAGVVREAVLELCGKLDLPYDDRTKLTVKDMLAAQEVFLTSSTMGIRPVVRIERHGVGDEKPGPITRKLMAAYEELLAAECTPGAEE